MKIGKRSLLRSMMLGTGMYMLDSARDRLMGLMDDARDGYGEASRRLSRAVDEIRGDNHRGMKRAAALLTGVGVGVGVGMLLAPASGKKTRANLSNKVHQVSDRVRGKLPSGERPATGTYGA